MSYNVAYPELGLGSDGQVLERYAPTTKPEALKADIEKALAAAK